MVRFVVVSDTHNRQESTPINVPDGDVLLHCGDLTQLGRSEEFKKANAWLTSLPHKTKIVIAGNHDIGLDVQ